MSSYGFLPYYWYNYTYCYNSTVDPTLAQLGNGDIGLTYQDPTNATAGACNAGAIPYFKDEIGFSVSNTNGTTWGTPTLLTGGNCTVPNAIEPSMAATGSNVYVAFVQANFSGQAGYYTYRPSATLGFTSSANDGVTFASATTIGKHGWYAHPVVAAVGNTVYIVYENLTNSTSYVSGGGPYCYYCTWNPVSIEFISSINGGATWSSPTVLPELNSTAKYFSIGPWIALNATGELAVSYFTNEHCVWWSYGYCYDYGFALVVSTSTNNGTTWSAPVTVKKDVGVTSYFGDNYFTSPPSQWAPHSYIAFNGNGSKLYLAWDGAYSFRYCCYGYEWYYSGVFFATGPSSGASWTTTTIQTSNGSLVGDNQFLPSLSVSGNNVYYTFTWANNTYGGYCGGSSTCAYLDGSMSQRVAVSHDGGLTWNGPAVVQTSKAGPYCTAYCMDQSFEGFQSSSIVTSGGTPLFGYAVVHQSTYSYSSHGIYYTDNFTYPTTINVAYSWSGATVSVNFTENGLRVAAWSFGLNGLVVNVTGKSFVVTNVPKGAMVLVSTVALGSGYGEQISATSSEPNAATYSNNVTVYFNYSFNWQVQFYIAPPKSGGFVYYQWYYPVGSSTYYEVYKDTYCYFSGTAPYCYSYTEYYGGSPFTYSSVNPPWYFPNGSVLNLGMYGSGISFWNGTGPGSFTGAGTQCNITITGVTNETGWVGAFGVYNETFEAKGLPSTSVFHYTFGGTNYSAPASQVSIATDVLTGAYPISNIWANSSTAGWEYFGWADVGSTVVVPVNPIVNLSFANVNLAAPVGTISFHATGISKGTVWHFGFNGTEYGSNTSWINVTAHPGSYPVAGYTIVDANGSVGYTPTGLTPTLSVTTGSTYSIAFTLAYRVDAVAGIGGAITGTGKGSFWIASGGAVSLHAAAVGAYTFGGWTGVGVGAYTGSNPWANFTAGGPISETAAFYPVPVNRFNLTFVETGLANGTWWRVFLGGVGYSSDLPVMLIPNLYPCGTLGTYNLSVPYTYLNGSSLVRYSPGTYPKTVCTNGATVVPISYNTQYYLTLESTAGGYGEATIGASTTTVSLWVDNGTAIQLTAISLPGYNFLGWNGSGVGSYTGTILNSGIIMNAPISELAAFALPYHPPPPRYWAVFKTTATLQPGTVWSIQVGGVGYSSTSSSINVTGLLGGSYTVAVLAAYSPGGLTRYSPVAAPPTVSVTHNLTSVPVSFTTSYWLTVTADYGGLIVEPATTSGWVSAGQTVTLNATPNAGYVFLGWTGTGTGAYTGLAGFQTIKVGSPVTEVATFGPAAPAVKIVTSNALWSAPTTWIGLAVAGLVVGLVVGMLMSRRGGGAAAAPPAPAEAAAPEGVADPPYLETSSEGSST